MAFHDLLALGIATGSTLDAAAFNTLTATTEGIYGFPAGTLVTNGLLVPRDRRHWVGQGEGTTILKLADGVDQDLVRSADFGTLTGGTTRGGPENWSIRSMTLDGNKTNNSTGWPIRVFAAAYKLTDVEIQNGASGGLFSEWGTGGTDMEAQITDFRVHDNDGDGIDWRGPHDAQFNTGLIFKNNGKGFVSSGNATSEQLMNVHAWGGEHTHGFYFSSPAYCVNCVAEGATTANVVLNVNFGSWIGGSIYGTDSGTETGIQIGDTSTARYWHIDTFMYNFAAAGRPLNYVSTNYNNIHIDLNAGSLTQAVHGSASPFDSIDVFCMDNMALSTESIRIQHGQTQVYRDASTRGMIISNVANTSFIEMRESSAVSNATANCGRLAMLDNGSGKTQFVVRFPSGATQVLATEP